MSFNMHEQPMTATELRALDGTLAVVLVPETRPPGARISCTVAGVTLHGKVVRQTRLSPDCLEMAIRLNNLSKADRDRLQAALPRPGI